MNNQLISFDIPKPCHENWDQMTAEARGRFCSSCNKTVVDFTHDSPDEIFATFRKSEGNLCGRFRADQLGPNRTTPLTAERQLGFMRKFFVAAVIVFGATLFTIPAAFAQHIDSLRTEIANQDARGENVSNAISGFVVDDSTEVGIGRAVLILYFEGVEFSSAISDENGAFTFVFDERVTVPEHGLQVVARHWDYEEGEPVTVTPHDRNLVARLTPSPDPFMPIMGLIRVKKMESHPLEQPDASRSESGANPVPAMVTPYTKLETTQVQQKREWEKILDLWYFMEW